MIPLKMLQMQGARFQRNEAYLSVRRSDEEIEATQQMGYFQRNHLYSCNLFDRCPLAQVFQPVLKEGLLLLLKYSLGDGIFLCWKAGNIRIFIFLEGQDVETVFALNYLVRIDLSFAQ